MKEDDDDDDDYDVCILSVWMYVCMYIFVCVKFEKMMMMIMIWMCGGGGVLSRRIGTHSPLALLKTSRHNILYCYCTILDFYLFRFVVSSRYSI